MSKQKDAAKQQSEQPSGAPAGEAKQKGGKQGEGKQGGGKQGGGKQGEGKQGAGKQGGGTGKDAAKAAGLTRKQAHKAIHPKYVDAKITCGCGNVVETRSTVASMTVSVCSKCHPFYSGQQRFLDTAGRVERFQKKYGWVEGKTSQEAASTRKEKLARAKAAAADRISKAIKGSRDKPESTKAPSPVLAATVKAMPVTSSTAAPRVPVEEPRVAVVAPAAAPVVKQPRVAVPVPVVKQPAVEAPTPVVEQPKAVTPAPADEAPVAVEEPPKKAAKKVAKPKVAKTKKV